ncbi:hypothetical protein AB1L30_12425 [Bremerella sp. JC817]|uniref:tetratricopeptide repeat protein n=1 Tax=Bremerella sp. JC817 TaxID=3231756 RepID=UPI00345B1B7F
MKSLVASGEFAKALSLVQIPGTDFLLKNAKGVCLLRLGKFDAAVPLYREIVFNAGCVWVRPEVPTFYKVNFATALILSGNIDGGSNILAQSMDENNEAALRLQACVQRWRRSYPLWKKIVWAVGLGPANNAPLTLDFEPGVFEDSVVYPLSRT